MRFLQALKNDIRYQAKYGFYLLYAFISTVYTIILVLCPPQYKALVASVIIVSDPAMLGTFFIGGIWLLEKEEGLHSFWNITPLRPVEYILSKAVSLGIISTIAAVLIVFIGLGSAPVNYFLLSSSIFFSSLVFTVLGLTIASYAQSVNHYLLLIIPLEIIIVTPPFLAAFGLTHPAAIFLPGTALWQLVCNSLAIGRYSSPLAWVVLALWFLFSIAVSLSKIPAAMQREKGAKA